MKNIFKSLFKRKPQTSIIYLKKWVEIRNQNLLQDRDFKNEESLFIFLMMTLSKFISDDSKMESKDSPLYTEYAAKYYNDRTLFELGCYILFRVDIWLIQQIPIERIKYSRILNNNYAELFSRIFPDYDVYGIFNNRLQHYAIFIRKGEEISKYHIHLKSLISLTGNSSFKSYEVYQVPYQVSSLMGDSILMRELQNFDNIFLPIIYDGLEKFFFHKNIE